MKSFNIQEALENPNRVITRDGRKVTELYLFNTATNNTPLVAVIDGYLKTFTKEGKYSNPMDKNFDLFLTPIKHKGYINIYKNSTGYTTGYAKNYSVFPTKQEAEYNALSNYVQTIQIEWEE